MDRRDMLRSAGAALVAGALVTVAAAPTAQAATYPSWKDVLEARKDETKKQSEIKRIKRLISQSKEEAERTRLVAEKRGAVYAAFREQVDAANDRLDVIREEIAAARKREKDATQRAGKLAAQLSRTGGADLATTALLAEGSRAGGGDFLGRLGRLSELTKTNGAIAAGAKQAKLTAAATAAQLKRALDELDELKAKAERAFDAAKRANADAERELARQQDLQITLEAKLKALRARTETTEAEYDQGIEAARTRAASASVPGDSGAVNDDGWALPHAGPITGPFGYRPDRPAGANPFHRGTDIGAAWGSPIYAAHSGTVIYAGWLGTYGNFIEIDHGGGVSTGYAHIRDGGIFVHVGQQVSGGQNIASIGTTGASTGPHLHFEVRINEVARDSVPFMAARGVSIG